MLDQNFANSNNSTPKPQLKRWLEKITQAKYTEKKQVYLNKQ